MTFTIDSTQDLAISSSRRSDRERSAVVPRESLSRNDRDQMFALFSQYFARVSRDVFERDLAEKDSIIVLRDADGSIGGFSTIAKFEVERRIVFFSGDTIVAEHRRGSTDLARLWV
jgi:hypothetical protein